jgi:predicted ester cyclase
LGALLRSSSSNREQEAHVRRVGLHPVLAQEYLEEVGDGHGVEPENRHDPAGTVATFAAEKASYDIPAFGPDGQVPDHAAIHELFVGMFSVFPDFHIESGPLEHGDDHVLVEVRLSGTQQADWAGIPNSGRSFETRVAAVYDFEGVRLVRERVYLDFGDIARQLTASE